MANKSLRVLLFDLDREGRHLIQSSLKKESPQVSLTVRARRPSLLQTLANQQFDALILGLPIEASLLAEILQIISTTRTAFPQVFLVGDGVVEEDHLPSDSYQKTEQDVIRLARELPDQVRGAQIKAISLEIPQEEWLAAAAQMRTLVADKAIASIGRLGLDAMYFSIDPRRGQWVIRASTYGDDVTSLIEDMVSKGGEVAPRPEEVPPDFGRLLRGMQSLLDVELKQLIEILMPWQSSMDSARLGRALDLERVNLLPVGDASEIHGVLALRSPLPEGVLAAVHEFVPYFARSLSQAMRMDERRARSQGLQTLQQILVSVSSTLDVDRVMEVVLDLLAEVISFDGARIYTREDAQVYLRASRGSMRVAANANWPLEGLAPAGSDFHRALESGESALWGEVTEPSATGEPESKPEWRSWIVVPIHWHGKITGVMTLVNRLAGFFQPMDLEIAEIIAHQLGVALENARLLEHSNLRAEKLKIVQEIGRSSVSLLDSQLLVFEAAQRVIQVFEYDQVGIFMVEEEQLIPEIYLYGKDLKERKGLRAFALNTGTIFDEVVRSNIPIILPGRDDLVGLSGIPGTKKAQSALLLPLAIKGAVVGVMLVLSHKADGIDEGDVEILQVLGAQLGISLVNARLFSEVRAHASKLEQRVSERTDELLSQKERTEAILRSVADAVMVLDLEGRLILANPMAQSLLSRAWSEQLYQKVVELQEYERQEHAAWEFGSESFEALSSNVELDGQVIGTVVVLRDITRLKELDRLKSQFVATVSHELRTPLANINLYLSLLRRSNPEREAHYYQTLESETKRLTTMIEDLLDLSRLDAERKIAFHPLALDALLEEIVEAQRPVCEAKRLELTYAPRGKPLILGNRDRLIQVFTNLFANAIAYTPAGNSIAVRMKPGDGIDGRPGVVVEVEDTGMGIPADELPYVFDRFYRGTMAQQLKIHGSGLGLAIVREIVESHGGVISVESVIGKGTCFQLWLPLVEGGEDNDG